jgi:hypothetical protein
MASRVARWFAVVLGAATVFWLGYSTGRVQSIGDISRLVRDADTSRYSLTRAGILLHYERLGGAGKPYVRTADGAELFELSDWDRSSRILVDGTLYELVRLYPTSAVDYERFRVAETLHGDGWQLEREVSLDADGKVHIDHSFVARRPIGRVDLALAHVRTYFTDVQVTGDGVTASVRLGGDRTSLGVPAPTTSTDFRIRVSPDAAGGAVPRFRAGEPGPGGVGSFVADFSVDQPPRDQRVLLGREIVHAESAQL